MAASAAAGVGTMLSIGADEIQTRTNETFQKWFVTFAIILKMVEDDKVPPLVLTKMTEWGTDFVQAVTNGEPPPSLGAGSSTAGLSEPKRLLLGHVDTGEIKINDRGHVINPESDGSEIEGFLQKLEKASGVKPNRGEDLQSRMESAVSRAKPVKVDSDSDASEVLAKVVKALGLDKDASPDDIHSQIDGLVAWRKHALACEKKAADVLGRERDSDNESHEDFIAEALKAAAQSGKDGGRKFGRRS